MDIEKVIFGAGNYGKKALKMLNKTNKCKNNIAFCDNFIQSLEDLDTGIKIISYAQLKEIYQSKKISVIIATTHFMEIYEQCILDEIDVDGIYDLESDSIMKYKEYCKKNYTGYSNDKWIQYSRKKQNRVIENAKVFQEGTELSRCITEVAIMISNLCNYASVHEKCPASLVKEKKIMSIKQIKMILSELKIIGFKGTICFHIYNDPMNDPRLFSILEYVKKELPDVVTEIYTNGYYLNQTICNEMQEGLVDILIVTGYGIQEYERILSLNVDIPFHVLYGHLDDRLENYDSDDNGEEGCCYSLISQVPIYVNGDLGLCCLDYKHDSNLGNVFEQGLINTLNENKVCEFQKSLLRGERGLYPLCKRCDWKR